MAEMRYAVFQFNIADNEEDGFFTIEQTDLDSIVDLSIEDITQEQESLNTIGRTYQVSYTFLTGITEGPISIFFHKIETDNSTTAVDRTTEIFNQRTNRLPIHAMPISSRDDNFTYNLMVPSWGTISIEQLTVASLRKTIQFEDEDFLPLIESGVDGTNGNVGFEMKLVHKAETFSTYDIIQVYVPL